MNSETITEILNNLFVDKRNKKSRSKGSETVKQSSKKECDSEKQDTVKQSSKKECDSEKQYTVKQSSKKECDSENEKQDTVKQIKSAISESKSKSKNESENKSENESKSESKSGSKSESKSESENELKSEKQNGGNRLDITKDDIITRNMLVVSYRFESVINILSIILEKIFDVELFDDTINVLTFSENEKYFKQMLINNPNINFDFKFRDTKHLNNNKIIIIDNEFVDDIDKYLDSEALIIVTTTRYQVDISELYNKMRDYNSTLLINKIDDLELLQKKLFKRIIKNNLETGIELDSFLESTKNHDYLFIKSGKLFFS